MDGLLLLMETINISFMQIMNSNIIQINKILLSNESDTQVAE